ncbi:hypothetical protein KDH_23230 [Dictyobacter sp. S3.2.2.5]|uniref:Uncharacterized protein n=1 Tax=Dictyobacter halimunensis TaxID=3026934 RepID=A0ABQ6FMK4_9CHLR|nr:hypothetical protein KDH_23230 [Dictyobacter sp. S3.2.2.5]
MASREAEMCWGGYVMYPQGDGGWNLTMGATHLPALVSTAVA